MADTDDDELLEALGVPVEAKPSGGRSPKEERIISGFEDILNFAQEHGRAPMHGEDHDIFERLYAVRLDRLRELTEYHPLLATLDDQGLLSGVSSAPQAIEADLDDDALLAELGIDDDDPEGLTDLKHVKPRAVADEIASRTPCKDFGQFQPMFQRVQRELDAGVRKTRRFQKDAEIERGEFFILGGQKAHVAEVGEEFLTEQGRRNARLRVIFDNGTESHGLLRSFQRALYKDEAGRRITDPDAGPLFDNG